MRYFSLIFVLFFLSTFGTTTTEGEFIIWNEQRKLNWEDFKAIPNNIGYEAAMTASSIEFGYTAKNNTYTFNIMCKFFPFQSWSIKDKQNDYILQHEQLHFDITELYTRKLIKEIKETIKYKKDVPKLKVIVQKKMNEWNKMQQKYDVETKHSINKEKQTAWNTYVSQQLDSLKEYKSASFSKILK